VSATVFFDSASELATLSNTFSVASVPTDPTTVTLIVTDPLGASTTYVYSLGEITRSSAGAYTKDIPCSESDTWQYEWIGTGAASDAEVGTWFVQETGLGKLYCPISALKSRLGIEHSEADFELHAACFAASRWIEQYTERIFWRTTSSARTFTPDGQYCLKLPAFCDLVSVSAVKTDTAGDGTFVTTLAASTYQLLPYNTSAAPETLPYNEIRSLSAAFPTSCGYGTRRNTVEVTGIWGWPKVPSAIRQAAAIIAADTFKLKDSPFGVEGQGEFTVNVGENRRALKFLDPYKRFSVLIA
jgi:hypothetical protein